jgi:DNA-binding MarR family transcriptional regulator
MQEPASGTLRLKHAERAVRRALEPALAVQGLTFEQWQVLAALLDESGVRMTRLAESACVPPATLTRHVDHLVGSALVIRRIDPDDRRSFVVALSPAGRNLATQLLAMEPKPELAALTL